MAATRRAGVVAALADNGVERGSCVQKYVRKIKKINPIYGGIALVMILLIVVLVALTTGGDDGNKTATVAPTTTTKKKHKRHARKVKPRRVKQAPIGTTGVIDQARREGVFAVAQARATVKSPGRVSVRMSAAPKQTVTVNWQLSCFKNRQVAVGKGQYRAKAPDERAIQLPVQGAETCIATAGAQLTRHGHGRVKVAVIGG
ncbi:MAG: hypothetical protein QOJ85_3524 [Solirubrobacteraceae bacterium]|jgi:hypothetical protein|nr:hypothetical protein [Solirubrobacteraceae bacterium]